MKKIVLSRLLVLLSLITLCGFMLSCEKNQSLDMGLTIGGLYETTVNDIEYTVSPVRLNVGGEVEISIVHKEGKAVPCVVYSKSLGFEEHIQTPDTLKKRIVKSGEHDLGFRIEDENSSTPIHVETVITAY